MPINITSESKEIFDSIDKVLSDACKLTMEQPIPWTQLVLLTDASFRNLDVPSWLKTIPIKRYSLRGKRTPPCRWARKFSPPRNSKCPNTLKKYLGIYMAFFEFAHILWEAAKPTVVLKDNKSVTRFFPNKGDSASTSGSMSLCVAI